MIPRPSAVRIDDGVFPIDPTTTLAAGPELAGVAGWLRGWLGPATGCVTTYTYDVSSDRRASDSARG